MFKQKILDNQEKIRNISIIEREINFDSDILKLNKIISFVGPRRAGKTYFMFQVVKKLINEGKISFDEIVFLDFSEILQKKIDFDKILENFLEIHPTKKPFFIFDEIQNVENFREGVISLFNKGYKIFISGSNAKLLSQEISTEFRGRNFETFILPLSFKEFLKFKNFETKNFYSTTENALLKNLFLDFLKYGAYPEIALIDNIQIKEGIIKDYFNLLVYKDLKERYKIDNDFALKYLVSEISKNVGQEFSINKIFTSLKSQGIKIGKDTLYNYLIYLENIFFSKRILNFYSPKGASKNYLFDLSFGNIFSSEMNFEKKFENAVFLELLRKNLTDDSIYFKKILTREINFFDEKNQSDIETIFKIDEKNAQKSIKNLKKSEEINKKIIFFEGNLENFSDEEKKYFIDFKTFFIQ
ncbi:ATP-binding protein [Candidatus Gracilibacteria bacterium]|nr:ATP-binding protein [Candidatus Gracilibacteria bacterium]